MSAHDIGADVDVAIVGCGPVGLVLAILLGQRGRSVAVFERWPSLYTLPRAVHFDHEVGRILQSCGLGDELSRVSEPAEVYEWRNAAGTTLLRFGRIGPGLSGWPQSSMFCQPELEAALDARARSLPSVEIRRGIEVVGLEQTDDAVEVRAADGSTVRSRFAVGCDGANSTVRDLLGIGTHDLGFFHEWLIVDVVLDEPRVFDPINVQLCDPERPTTMVSGGPGRRRWEFMCLPGESIDELNDERRAWELLAPWDVHPGNARLERHAVYRFQARHAERWRDGCVFLAGDAAHQMPPFAGQGMCAGVRDAANLSWKLDVALDCDRFAGADALLDTYEEERLPSVIAAIEFSIELGKVICVPDHDEAAARDEAMAAAVTGALTDVGDLPGIESGFLRAGDPVAGQLVPQPMIDGRRGDDVVGAGWRLVTVADHALDATTARWFAERDISHVLQRPDFHAYGSASTDAGAAELLADVRKALPSSTAITGVLP